MTPLTRDEQLAIVETFSQLKHRIEHDEDAILEFDAFQRAYRGPTPAVRAFTLETFNAAPHDARKQWIGQLIGYLNDEIPGDVWTEYLRDPTRQ